MCVSVCVCVCVCVCVDLCFCECLCVSVSVSVSESERERVRVYGVNVPCVCQRCRASVLLLVWQVWGTCVWCDILGPVLQLTIALTEYVLSVYSS